MRVDQLKTLWPELEPLFDQLIDLEEPERSRMLDRLTAGAPETRRALEALLRADREGLAPVDRPALSAGELGAAALAAGAIEPGTRFGPYVVRRELGRGGMGTVVLAERDDGQFAQQVAIKWVRPDAWAPGARERFVQERRILARLEHPNIARLIDGGVREDGSPFLVMEYVEGRPITAWCDARRLDVRGRVELFRQVCAAVEYAHGRLVVHRDLKPENILVTEKGEAKLLDFGIAKLLGPDAEGAMTGTQTRILTPAYATPEQYLGGELTAATDEYQLALVLYELLTGRRAHGDSTGSPLAQQRRVLDTDPEPPSRRVTRAIPGDPAAGVVAPAPATIAEARASSVESLSRELGGDLDAILLRALEREPGHRYVSVAAFRRDLSNSLGEGRVAARRHTTGYRVRKYARRHRVAVVAGALVALSLLGGLAGVVMQARVASRERDLARASERKATAINDFVLRELLESPTPERALGRPLTVAEVLASASRTVEHAFSGEPVTEAGVRMTLARSYQALGRPAEARAHAEAARQLLDAHLPPTARERFESRELLASLDLDQGHYEVAEPALERLTSEERRVLGASDPATLAAEAEHGRALTALGRFAAADSTLRAALAQLAPPGGEPWRLAVDLRRALASVWIEQSRARDAESLLAGALSIERRHLGNDHPLIAATMRQQANALAKDLRQEQSLNVFHEVLAMSVRLNGEAHPATGDAYASYGAALDGMRRHGEALAAVRSAVAIYRHALGDEHPKTLRALRNEAVLLRGAQRYAEAEPVYQEVYRTCVRTLGPDHRQTLEALGGLVFLRLNEGRTREAAEYARRIVASYERLASKPDADPTTLTDYAQYLVEAVPPEVRDPGRAVEVAQRAVEATGRRDYLALRALGFAQDAAGQLEGAVTSLRAALALPDGVRSWTTEEMLVQILRKHGAPGELERTLRAHLADERALRGDDDRYIGKTLRHLSRCYRDGGRDSLAVELARESLAQLLKTLPPTHWEVGRARAELGGLLLARGAYAEAESLLVQGFRTQEADPEVDESDLRLALANLVRLYSTTNRPAAARRWREHTIAARAPVDP